MKFLVLGCNGMAGHMISLYLKESGHEVLGFAFTKSQLVESVTGNAMDLPKLKEIVNCRNFDSIINCIGILNQFADSNKSDAIFLNSFLPHCLVQLTEKSSTQIIHMSTDCVFSGKRGQYTEDDLPDGETYYDRTKALGEICDEKNVTLRCSIVGPDINVNGIGLLNWFMKQNGTIKGYTRAIWTGQTTLQLAKTMEAAARSKAHGLYNMVPDQSITKYDLLSLFNKYLKKEKVDIIPDDKVFVDKSLKRTRREFNYEIPDYESMVVDLAEWMKSHKDLYPHYDL